MRIVYSSITGDTLSQQIAVGFTELSIRAGGRLLILAEAHGYHADTVYQFVDSAMAIEIELMPKKASVTIEAFDLAGNEERGAKIFIDARLTDYRPFEEFHLASDRSYTIVVKLTLPDGRKTGCEPRLLRLPPGVDTSISCVLRPSL